MALVAIIGTRPARSSPADVFAIGAPTAGTTPAKAADIQDGDASVSTQTGALDYSYPIRVPPGRQGVQPHLALAYSSQAATHGGIAAGWSLSIPSITEDTSQGRLWATAISVPVKNYVSSMAAGRPLIPVGEPAASDVAATFRAQNDGSFIRYQRMRAGTGYPWRALAPSGTTFYFGEADHVGNCATVSDGFAPLTRTVDSFGNSVDYTYESHVSSECRIKRITWGANAGAGLADFAAIDFTYAEPAICAGSIIGSQTSYRTGTRMVTGASILSSIAATAFSSPSNIVHHRVITLTYSADDMSCSAPYAPFRSLQSIQESAWGADSPRVDLPAVTFTYGPSIGSPTRRYPASVTTISPPPWPAGEWSFNLGWGRSFPSDKWPTVEEMMLDIDGDGRLDRVYNNPVIVDGHVVSCRASWLRNSNGFFGDVRSIPLPTLKWASEVPQDVYHGGDYAEHNASSVDGGRGESCALNYQESGYINAHPSANLCGDGSQCNARGFCTNGSDCTAKNSQGNHTNLAYRWFDIDGDGLVDLVASIASGGIYRYNLQQGNGRTGFPPAPVEPLLFGNFPPCPATSVPGMDPADGPYTMCGGMYPWFVYRNHGNGIFGIGTPSPLPDRIIYQPVPLETSFGDSSLMSSPVGQFQGILDIDGDGYPDSVSLSEAAHWKVFRNDGTGVLNPAAGAIGFFFFTPEANYPLSQGTFVNGNVVNDLGLFDVNGDGLIDHWNGSGPVNADVNDGVKFLTQESALSIRPGSDSKLLNVTLPPGVLGAARVDPSRVLDIDSDGRPDVIQVPVDDTHPRIHFNLGDDINFSGVSPSGYEPSLLHKLTSIVGTGSQNWSRWEIRSDMIDLDGDGILEGVDFGDQIPNPLTMKIARVSDTTLNPSAAPLSQPPRLLIGIDEGRGATTSIEYASMSDGSAVDQHPDVGNRMPHTQWVARSLSVVDTPAHTTTTTSYFYKNPVYSPDDRGKYGFRGFEEVITLHASRANTVQRYDYSIDWRGRLKTTLSMPNITSSDEVHSIDETTWSVFTLLNHIVLFSATASDHWICRTGQDESQCRTNTDSHTHTDNVLTALSSTTATGGPPLLYEVTKSTLTGGDNPAARITDMAFAVHADANVYRVQPLSVTRSSKAGSQSPPVLYNKTAHTWDPTHRVALTDEKWVDAVDANRTITRRTFDMATGNVTARWKPEQNAANTTYTSFTYDARKLFVATEVNELGFGLGFTYEYGTGMRLVTTGPNVALCATVSPPTCRPGDPLKEERRIRIDGLGRTIERWEPFGDDGSTYVLYKVELASYDDASWRASSVPTSVTRQHAFDALANGAFRFTRDKTEFDGQGRVIKKTIYTFGTVAKDSITTYQYRNDGTLSSITVPDPSGNTCSFANTETGCTVRYNYTFDTLGRPSSVRRPDSTTPAMRSGIDISYDGLSQTTREVVGAAGEPAVTKTIRDAFGRVVEVDELRAAPDQYAATVYTYDNNDYVATVRDAESNVTTLTHDFAGRRTQITTAGKSSSYTYDRNGNLVSELSPGWASVVEQPSFTTTIAYDDLDRPLSRSIGQRRLSAADQALFAAGTETYHWDYGGNHTGYLRYWTTRAPGSTTSAVLSDLGNNIQGQRTLTNQTINLAGYTDLKRQFLRLYYISGAPRRAYYRDYVGDADVLNESTSIIQLDARGLPASVLVTSTSAPPQTIAVQTRNIPGLVIKRRTDVANQPMTFVESNWTYDKLGRVTSQVVQKGPGPTQVAREDIAYFGNDDPSQLDHWLGATNHKQFHFTYDPRHQLTGVTETAAGGAFGATYTYGAAGRFASALETRLALPGSDVKPRNVTYQYSTSDPQLVTALRNSDSSSFATYTYDASGNQLSREYPGSDRWDYVYDGADRLRRATKKNAGGVVQGSEEYWYDGSGQRIVTVKRNAAGNKTEMIWVIGDAEAHYDASGEVTRVYSHVSLGTPVARIDRTSNTTTLREFQFHSLADSTLAAVADSGQINAQFVYAPFGEIVEAAGSGASGPDGHRRRFNDKYVDELTDLGYYGARYYDKTLIGWTQPDPSYRTMPDRALLSPRKANLYQFTLSNPLRYLDPDGRDSKTQTSTSATEVLMGATEDDEAQTCFDPQACFVEEDEEAHVEKELDDFEQAELRQMLSRDRGADSAGSGPLRNLPGPLGRAFQIADTVLGAEEDYVRRTHLAVTPVDPSASSTTNAAPDVPNLPDRSGKSFTRAGKRQVWDANKGETGSNSCANCGRPVIKPQQSKSGVTPPGNEGHVDHVHPKSRGGAGAPSNGQLLCRDCNLKKSNKVWEKIKEVAKKIQDM